MQLKGFLDRILAFAENSKSFSIRSNVLSFKLTLRGTLFEFASPLLCPILFFSSVTPMLTSDYHGKYKCGEENQTQHLPEIMREVSLAIVYLCSE